MFANPIFKMVGAYPADKESSTSPVSPTKSEKPADIAQDQENSSSSSSLPPLVFQTPLASPTQPLSTTPPHPPPLHLPLAQQPPDNQAIKPTPAASAAKNKRAADNDWSIEWTPRPGDQTVPAVVHRRKRTATTKLREEATLLGLLPNTMLTPGSVPKYSTREMNRVKQEKEKEIEKIRLQLQERLDVELREKKIMESILDEFEKMLNDIHDVHEKERKEWDRWRREFAKAKSDMEESFGQLLKKYEEKKILIEQYRKNEELLHKTIDTFKQDAVIYQQRYDKLKNHATQKLKAAAEAAKERSDNEKQSVELKVTQIKASEIIVKSLEQQLEAKERQMEDKERLLRVKAKQLEDKEKELRIKDEQLKDSVKQLHGKDEQLDAKERQLRAKEEENKQLIEFSEQTTNTFVSKPIVAIAMSSDPNIAQFCAITNAKPDVAVNFLRVCITTSLDQTLFTQTARIENATKQKEKEKIIVSSPVPILQSFSFPYNQISDGNLATAVQLYLESGGLASTSSASVPSSADSPSRMRSRSQPSFESDEELARRLGEENDHTVRAPIAPKREVLFGGGNAIASFSGLGLGPVYDEPGGYPTRARTSRHRVFDQDPSPAPLYEAFRDFTAEAADREPGGRTEKAQKLAEIFRPPIKIMFKKDFESARSVARTESKWLMVNIQNSAEFVCQVMNRDLWSSSAVKELLGHTSTEGTKYMALYPFKNYPHVAIIDPATVTEFLENPAISSSRSTRTFEKKNITKDIDDMTEEEQFNAAIAASLGTSSSDSSSDSHSPVVVPSDDDDEDELMEDDHTEQPPQTPAPVAVPISPFEAIRPVKRDEPADPKTSTRVQFRLADGSRVIRRFSKSDPVRYLFEFVKAEVPNAQDQPFELVFNRQQLIDLIDQSITEAGLENAAVNFVFA
ncbi:hypothetical protein BC937DRAFT_91306 [Endogone sp. FLAS-F59071]|nr:hypothetical protein BC937DRAFT_91306 [Endogone sp. FLAS-F59071]|eukprot:RUS21846.1 hypothetical protein BC937DRAFT_91306 [Endogone sp. FLAS-F59071]